MHSTDTGKLLGLNTPALDASGINDLSLWMLHEIMNRLQTGARSNDLPDLRDLLDLTSKSGTGAVSTAMLARLRMSMNSAMIRYKCLGSKFHSDKKLILPGNSGTFKAARSQHGPSRVQHKLIADVDKMIPEENPDEVRFEVTHGVMSTHNMLCAFPTYPASANAMPGYSIWKVSRLITAHLRLFKSIEIENLGIKRQPMGTPAQYSNPTTQLPKVARRLLPGRGSVTSVVSIEACHAYPIRIPRASQLNRALPASVPIASRVLKPEHMIPIKTEHAAQAMAVCMIDMPFEKLWWLLVSLLRPDMILDIFRRVCEDAQGYQLEIPLTESAAKTERKALSLFANDKATLNSQLFVPIIGRLASLPLVSFDAVHNVYHLHPSVQQWARVIASKATLIPNAPFRLTLSLDSQQRTKDRTFRQALVLHVNKILDLYRTLESNKALRLLEVYSETNQVEKQDGLATPVAEQETISLEQEDLAPAAENGTETGQSDRDEELAIQDIETRKRVLGEDHPDTVKSMKKLASKYYKQGRYAEAETLEVEVVAARTRALGDDHPDTLNSMNNLAITYHQRGRLAEAEALSLIVVAARKRVLGEDHPYTLASMSSLSATYSRQGRIAEAEALKLDVVATRKRVLGKGHPKTLGSMGSLARNYSAQGRTAEAEALEADIAATRKRVEKDRQTR